MRPAYRDDEPRGPRAHTDGCCLGTVEIAAGRKDGADGAPLSARIENARCRSVDQADLRNAAADKREIDRVFWPSGEKLACSVKRIDEEEFIAGLRQFSGRHP